MLATWTWTPSTTSAGYVYEDADANFAITFPGKPSVAPKDSSGIRATYSTAPDPNAPDAVVYAARGTAATGIEILPETLETVVLTLVDQGAVLTAPEVTFELEGMPAIMNELTLPTGKAATFVVAGDGNRIYQLLVVGGTPEERQAFFDSFELLS